MDTFESLLLAYRSIKLNGVRSLLTMLGVIIGVMSVILLISMGEGAQAYVENEFAAMGSNILIIKPGKTETAGAMPVVADSIYKLSYTNAQEIVRKVKNLRGVAPYTMGAGAVQYGDRRRNTAVLGVTPEFEQVRRTYAQIGRFIRATDIERNMKVCVIGTVVRDELFGKNKALSQWISINRAKHLVVGVLEQKGVSLGINLDDIVIIPLPSAQQMFHGGEDELFEILVATHTKDEIRQVIGEVRDVLTAAHRDTEDFSITDQDGLLGSFGQIFDGLKLMLLGIACVSLFVGGIGIMNIMLVSVRERTKEVGIRKAVGATRWDIRVQFLVESMAISVTGGLLGIGLGWTCTLYMQIFYPNYPVILSSWSVVLAFFFSVAVGVLSGAYPAFKASSVDPVEALRYE